VPAKQEPFAGCCATSVRPIGWHLHSLAPPATLTSTASVSTTRRKTLSRRAGYTDGTDSGS